MQRYPTHCRFSILELASSTCLDQQRENQSIHFRGPPWEPCYMGKSTLKIDRYCPLVMYGFSYFLRLFQVITGIPDFSPKWMFMSYLPQSILWELPIFLTDLKGRRNSPWCKWAAYRCRCESYPHLPANKVSKVVSKLDPWFFLESFGSHVWHH